ncbi:hypothetical protein ACFRH6_06090 [Streptomyces sp. NPDC056749]|uniref:hypothetical protein n=1 Tax=Streptomyces sp. NPDC056749 TaxID=3345936 RepID=UPI0036B741F1
MTGTDTTAPPGSRLAVVTGAGHWDRPRHGPRVRPRSTLVVAIGQAVLDAYGRPDVLVGHAGIVRSAR